MSENKENFSYSVLKYGNLLLKESLNLLTNINNFIVSILDNIVNSSNYKYYISTILTLVFILIVILINLTNISDKQVQIIMLSVGGLLLSIFYFFVYRNEQEDESGKAILLRDRDKLFKTNYLKENKRLVKEDNNKKVFNSDNLKNTIVNPLINLFQFSFFIIAVVLFLVLIISTIYYLYNKYNYLYSITKIVLGILIIISILSIIAKIFSQSLDNCEYKDNVLIRIICLIKNFIMFLPCLLVIIVDEISEDIKGTPKSIYILFIILLFLVLLFIGLPLLFELLSNLNKNDLLSGKGPYYLNRKREIGRYQDLSKNYKYIKKNVNKGSSSYSLFNDNEEQDFNIKAEVGDLGNKKMKYNYTYSLSFYLYLNPQPENTSIAYNRETELFNYGNKPVILYDGRSRNLIIKSKTKTNEGNQMDTIYKTKNIKYQKWMLITINYEDNMIDVFIDNKLVGSKKNVSPYFDDDKVTIGEDNGIHGSIKDIYYFDKIKPMDNIEFLYSLSQK